MNVCIKEDQHAQSFPFYPSLEFLDICVPAKFSW